MFSCHGCGADLRFSPEKQKLVCDFCGSEYSTKEYNEQAAYGAREESGSYAVNVFTCPQCGGELLTQEDTAATFCSYCGSSVMLEKVIREEMKPDYIIPFKVTREDCEKAYRKMIANARYLPKEMKEDSHIAQFRAIYMPFWVYEYEINNFKLKWQYPPHVRYEHMLSEYINLSIDVDGHLEGPAYDASSTFADPLCNAIAPFNIKESKAFSPAYLSGFYADSNDLDHKVYEKMAETEAKDYLAYEYSTMEKIKGCHMDQTDLKNEMGNVLRKRTPKLAFYPVWFLASKNRNGKKVSYAVVNGQSGKISADLPLDFRKYLLTTLLMAVPIFLILNLLLSLTPAKAVIISMILALCSIKIAKDDGERVLKRLNGSNDYGRSYMDARRNFGKPKKIYQDYNYLRPLIGVILGLIVLIINPAEDMIFYGASALIGILVILTFLKIVENINLFATRELPQLGKRGGEEHV